MKRKNANLADLDKRLSTEKAVLAELDHNLRTLLEHRQACAGRIRWYEECREEALARLPLVPDGGEL